MPPSVSNLMDCYAELGGGTHRIAKVTRQIISHFSKNNCIIIIMQ